jgi:hypothetical protein
MKTTAIAFLASVLPAQAWAQTTELTLSCQYESSYQPLKGGSESPPSGAFSAIVHMNQAGAFATIEATTPGCFDYVGSFTNLEVAADCERTVAGVKVKATLTIDRIDGIFQQDLLIGSSLTIYSGRCTLAKKLF